VAGSAVWVDVLPSMGKFSTNLTRDASSAAATAGVAAGRSFDGGFADASGKGSAAGKILGGIAGATASAAKVIGGGIAGIGLAVGGLSAQKGLSRLLDIDDAQGKLKGLGHSVDGIATIMDSALASVKGTAFGLGDAATVAASAVAAGIKPGQDLTKYLSLTADAATIAGTSLDEMGAIINKTTSTGKVYTDNLNQLADRGIPIFQWLQEEYGTSAEGLSKMVKEGKVDAETFRRVIEENIGGAALASGQTVRGAFANTGAAFGRLGAMFLKGGVQAAPVLFTAITGAVDRAGTALAPFADALGVKVVAGLTAVAGWIDRVDFQKIVDGASGLYDLIVGGDFSGKLTNAFGLQEDSGFVDFILTARDAISGLYSLVVGGDFTGAFARAFNVEEDSPVVGMILDVRSAFGDLFSAIGSGDLDGAKAALGGIADAGGPLSSLLGSAAGGFGQIAGAVGDLFVAGLPLIPALIDAAAQVMGFLADNSSLVLPIIIAIAAGFVLYRTSQVAANAAMVAGLPIRVASIAADVARTIALNNSTKATIAQMGIEKASAGTRIAATGSITAATVATNGFGWAQRASAVASAIAAGGMRLLGGAVRFALGPIGLIITAVGLLVAGVIWAYNNVGWFRDGVNGAFAGIMVAVHALGDAGVWLWENALKPAWDAIAAGATWLYETILRPAFDGISIAVQAVGAVVGIYIGVWVTIFQAIGTAAVWLWQTILEPVFSGIAAVVSWFWSVASAVFDLLVHVLVFVVGAAVTWLWESIISPVFTWIGDKVSTFWLGAQIVFGALVSFVRDTLGAVFSWLWDSIISPVFTWISNRIDLFWTGAQIIFAAVTGYVRDTLGPIFTWLYENAIRPAWDGISSAISTVWGFISPIFDKLKTVIMTDLPNAFTTGRDAIGTAWEGLKELAKAPIKFVVDTVINDGLIGNFNKVADFFGSKKIPTIKLPDGFAGGGIIPGYQSQKRDDVMMPMRRGEGVLVPEVVKGLGPGFVHSLNAAGNRGGASAVRSLATVRPGLAEGGIVGGAIDWVRNAADAAGRFVSDPLGTMSSVIDGLTAQIPGAEGLVALAKGATGKLVEAAVDAIKGLMPSGGAAGAIGSNGSLPAGMLQRVANFTGGPGVGPMGGYLRSDAARALQLAESAKGGPLALTEGYRDLASQQMRWAQFRAGTGNLAAAPGTSNHGYGLAGDFATSAQGWLRTNGPRFGWYPTGLGFSQREPWHFDYKGKADTSAGMHEGGVIEPTLYDEGGVLPRGVSVIANRTRKPEYNLPEGRLIDVVRKASAAELGEQGPLIGSLTLQSSGDLHEDLAEVNHNIRTLRRGGRP